MDIEKLATSAVKSAISKTNHLKAFISDEDKEPCWDGNIYFYEKTDYSKRNIRKIAAQVKGKKVGVKKIKNSIKYNIDTDDLRAYMMNGGTLYFVVYLDKETGECLQIYYVALYPIKIQRILDKRNTNKHSVMLKKYPQNIEEQEEIVLRFYSDAKRQASFAGEKLPTIEQLSKNGELDSISFHIIGKELKKHYSANTIPLVIPKYMENKEFTLYANTKGGVVPIPIEYYECVESVTTMQVINDSVGVEATEFYNAYKLFASVNCLKYQLGTCVTVTMPNTLITGKKIDTSDVSIQMRIDGTLNERIKGIEFILSIIKRGSLHIGKATFAYGKSGVDSSVAIDTLTSILVNYKKAKSVLDSLHIEDDLDLNKCGEEDYINLNMVIAAIGDKLPVKHVPKDFLNIQFISISNLNIAVIYDRINDYYYMLDYYGRGYQLYNKKNGTLIPRFWRLTVDIILKSSNLYLDAVVSDYKSLDQNEENCNSGNDVLLEMIKAYDIKPKPVILDAINGMIDWLNSQTQFIDKDTIQLNKLQVVKRIRLLSFEEKSILYTIVNNTCDIQCKIGALLLLDEQVEADNHFAMLSPKEKERFKTYPIYRFYRNTH